MRVSRLQCRCVPDESGHQATSERAGAFRSPNGLYTMKYGLVFLSVRGAKAVRLYAGLDHVYRIYDGPQLDKL